MDAVRNKDRRFEEKRWTAVEEHWNCCNNDGNNPGKSGNVSEVVDSDQSTISGPSYASQHWLHVLHEILSAMSSLA